MYGLFGIGDEFPDPLLLNSSLRQLRFCRVQLRQRRVHKISHITAHLILSHKERSFDLEESVRQRFEENPWALGAICRLRHECHAKFACREVDPLNDRLRFI
jgi:hypothetical protein